MPQVSVRSKIVDSGMQVMYAQGFNGCSVQDITDHAGVPKGSFYNHFASKEVLALEVLDKYMGLARMDLLEDPTKPPLERLVAHFRFVAKIFKAPSRTMGCLAGNFGSEMSTTSPAIREALVERFKSWNGGVARIYREAQAAGDVNAAHDPARLARFTVAAWQGVVLSMKINQSTRPLDDFFALLPAIWVAEPAKKVKARVR